MSILHIIRYEKFTEPYIKFINNNFDKSKHLFIAYGNKKNFNISDCENVRPLSKNIFFFLRNLFCSEKIIIHCLPNFMICLLFIMPYLLKKCYWVIWGGDLYYYQLRHRNLKSDIKEFFRRHIIKKLYGICTLVKGDFSLAKQWYDAKGNYFSVAYINPVKLEYLDSISSDNPTSDSSLNIQIGNSADSSNKHIEILDSLNKYKDENIKIYAPLSYGEKEYAKKVEEYGKKLFGDKFVAILDFLNPRDYADFLTKIDIAIFAHERQQALSNIYALIYLGKKVYIRNDISTWGFLNKELNVKIYDYMDINNSDYKNFIQKEYLNDNKNKIRQVFDEREIKKSWEAIFNENMGAKIGLIRGNKMLWKVKM